MVFIPPAKSSNARTLGGKLPPSGDIVGSTDTQTISNKTINDTLNMTTGAITQAGTAAHITLTPGTSKVVKIAIVNKNASTVTYPATQIFHTGSDSVTILNGGTSGAKDITFGVTFTATPKVFVMVNENGGTVISPGENPIPWVSTQTTTSGFTVTIFTRSTTVAGDRTINFVWLAVGEYTTA